MTSPLPALTEYVCACVCLACLFPLPRVVWVLRHSTPVVGTAALGVKERCRELGVGGVPLEMLDE